MSTDGIQQQYIPASLDGLVYVDVDGLTVNGVPVDLDNLVPYTNATKNLNLGTFNFETLGGVSAPQHVFTPFTSTLMTGAMTSSIFTADAWGFANTISTISLSPTVTASYLTLKNITNNNTVVTFQNDGSADFGNTHVRLSTMASNVYDVVNLSTLQASNAFIENVNALNYVPYTGATDNLNMGASTITTTGYISTAYLTLSEATNSEAWTLYTISTMGNLSTLGGLVIQETTSGNSVYLTGGVVGAKNFQFSSPGGVNAGKVVCTDGNSVMSTTISAGQLQYINALHSNAGGVGETNTWSNTQTFSVAPTLNSLTTATPSFSLGIDGSNQVIKFTPAVSGGTVNTSTTTARFIPYLSTATTLTNSLLNQIDNDSMGFGYTAIPNYPLGSAKNMYVNGSIFAGGLNSMVGTFGRDTNTSNPANEITFVAGGAGTLLTQVKSHSGSSAFVDATWTYSNTNPAPLGANQGQVLLTADKLTLSLTNGLAVAGAISATTNISVSGDLKLVGTSDCKIYNGNIDTYNPTGNNNLMIRSWWGIGFPSYDNIVRIGMDTRTGNADFVGTLTSKNAIVNETFKKLGGASGTNYIQILGNDANSPYIEFLTAGVRRAYIGYATPTTMDMFSANGASLRLGSENGTRMTINTDGSMTHTAGDLSYMRYGPNSTWNSYLTVGATPDRSAANNAQVITTNGNLHLDAGNSADIFYGYYANARGTPNIHRWYGGDYQFSGVAQNYNQYSQVCVFAGDQMRRSQAIQRKIADYYGGWGSGYNVSYAFYKYNTVVPVRIHGYYSGWWSSSYMGYAQIRIYNQTNGVYTFKVLPTFTNNAYNHITIPMDVIFTDAELTTTGWYDVMIMNYAGINTDANDVLMMNVSLLPAYNF